LAFASILALGFLLGLRHATDADVTPTDVASAKQPAIDMPHDPWKRHFPALAPMVRHHALATPLTQRRNVRTPQGSTCGIELTAERLSTPALHIQTPLPGLLLAGAGHLRPRCAGGVLGWLAGGDKRRFGAACPVECPKRRVRPRLQ